MGQYQKLAFIGCRLLALYFVFNLILHFVNSLIAHVAYSAGTLNFGTALYMLMYLCLSLLLWFAAGWLSARIVEGDPDQTDTQDLKDIPLTMIAVSLIGLWFVVSSLAPIISSAVSIEDVSNFYKNPIFNAAAVKFLVGFILVAKSRSIARLVSGLRT